MTHDELVNALSLDDFSWYYKKADEIREQNCGDYVDIRAILEFSNHCVKSCIYCGINACNKNVERYRIPETEIIKTAKAAYECGYQTVVLQSGEDAYYTTEVLCQMVSEIKKYGIKITLSCGEREDYQRLKESGADRYLLKQETSAPDIYKLLHPNSSLTNRIRCLKTLKQLGYETGSGFMVGLPNQTLSTIANDILLLEEIGCDMAGIGPFIPHPKTQLHALPAGSTALTKRAVALTRIQMPKINLPATTALGIVNNTHKNDVFSCGANVVMRKVTPSNYKYLYEIYPAKMTDTNILQDRLILEKQIKALGRIPR